MKIWKSFGSAHSAHLTIISEFADDAQVKKAKTIVEDFVNAAYNERYPNIEAFLQAWKSECKAIESYGPQEGDFNIGMDNNCEVHIEGKKLVIPEIRGHNIGGIIKLLLLYEPKEVKITGRTGP